MQSIVIRAAREGDAPGIARVHVAAWRTTYRGLVPDAYLDGLRAEPRQRLWTRVIGEPAGAEFVYVAEEGGAIVGFAAGGPEREGRAPHTGELYAIYLLASHQRLGLGRRLAQPVARRLLADGHAAMLVWVLAGNPACRFYEALGGQPVATKLVELGGVALEEVAYGWADLARLARDIAQSL